MKSKSLLIITQHFKMGGLETYINTQINSLAEDDFQIHLMCGSEIAPSLLPQNVSTVTINEHLSLSTLRSLVRGIDIIRDTIRNYSIDIVHVHPFDCIFPAVIAADCEDIPSLLTLHGPLSLQHFTKNMHAQMLTAYFLKTLSGILCVSEEVFEQLQSITDHPSVQIIPNLIDTTDYPSLSEFTEKNGKWLVASRLDNDKSPGILKFIDLASRCNLIEGIDIYGTGDDEDMLKNYVNESGFDTWICFKGITDNILPLMPKYTGFAGMGRGVLEAAFSEIPICLVGYDGIKGMLTDNNFDLAARCNFSGRNMQNLDDSILLETIKEPYPISGHKLTKFKADDKWKAIIDNCISAYYTDNNSDSLELYSKLLEAVQFDNEINYTDTQDFITIMFNIISKELNKSHNNSTHSIIENSESTYMDKIDSNNQVISTIERQEQILKDVNDRISELEKNNLSLKEDITYLIKIANSISHKQREDSVKKNHHSSSDYIYKFKYWIGLLSEAPLNSTKRYELARAVYWKLPEYLRLKLNSQRYKYVQKNFNSRSESQLSEVQSSATLPDWVNTVNSSDKVIFIPCSFEFDELVNQRPINAAKYFSENGYQVIYVAWQWNPQDILSKGCAQVWENVYQVPLYEFVSFTKQCVLKDKVALYILTLPAEIFMSSIYELRAQGCYIAYDIMDEWECFNEVGQAPWYKKEIEEAIILQSDYVCGVAPALRDKFSYLRKDIAVIGNGYSVNVLGDTKNIAKINSKKIGYFGHLTDSWFDWDILFKLVETYPNYLFEIIGYGEPDWVINKAKEYSNLNLIGKVMPQDLHQYVENWTLGLIPFKKGRLAEAVDPIKIYEYLYFGLPTLVTGIKHIERYPMTYFSDGSDISQKFEQAIASERSSDYLESFLNETTWTARFAKMEGEILGVNSIGKFYAA